MKKTLTVLLMLSLLLVGLASCGSEDSTGVKCADAVKTAVENTGEEAFDTIVPYGDEVYETNFEKLYNFPLDDVSDGVLAYASGGGADEISMVKAKDANGASAIKKYMEARQQQRLSEFQNYKPEEASKIENGLVVVQKQYVILILSDHAQDLANEIQKALNAE